MCYDAEISLRKQLKEAAHRGAPKEEVDELWRLLIEIERKKYGLEPLIEPDWSEEEPEDDTGEYYHVSGFAHPKVLIMTDCHKPSFEIVEWGFIASAAKFKSDAYSYDPKKRWMNNLNAQVEGIFEKRTFSKAAKYGRAVMRIEAFYEHHHQNKQTYPFHIRRVDGKEMFVACIYQKTRYENDENGDMHEKNTMAIVTTAGNEIMGKLHNNPALLKRSGPRMPMILDEDQIERWLVPYPEFEDPKDEEIFQQELVSLGKPLDETELQYVPVCNLKKRKDMEYLGNVPEIRNRYDWPDLELSEIFA